ncbi:MAG: 4'-phosphopantetheinyl transferase superfamily protein [Lachnospiraceae bacterium]|nr:4'-phosphopantetheinyl transferase superfamily protein [Lachnospiraceae bacterium]
MSIGIFYASNFIDSVEIIREKLFSEAFQTFFGFPYQEAEISISSGGKPEFKAGCHAGCFFNLSHSKTILALACSTSLIGIDVEDQRFFSPKLIQRISSKEELLTHEESLVSQSYALALWTFKEAYVKYTGNGLREPFHSFSVPNLDDSLLAQSSFQLMHSPKETETLFFFSMPILHSRLTICSTDPSSPQLVPLIL